MTDAGREVDQREALAALEAGRVVAIPTDTVYGLAARIDRPGAIARIFDLKGRPADLALPVLVGRWRQVRTVAADWPRNASMVAARFWPGPLTVVVTARPEVGPLLGGDGRTSACGVPVTASSGRCAGRPARSPSPAPIPHGSPPCATAAGECRPSFFQPSSAS